MSETSKTSNHMGTAGIPGLVLKTGVPLMVSLLINSLYNFVDSIFVSRISEDALTALSLAAPIQILMSAMGLGIAVGLNAVISKALGERDEEKVEKTASAALVLAFLAWVLVVALEVLAMRTYFRWQSSGNETIAGLSRFGNLKLIWLAFVLAEVVVIPIGILLWRKESGKILKPLEQNEKITFEGGKWQ